MILNGVKILQTDLILQDELLEFLRESGESDRALAHIREQNHKKFGNELIWRYPISDGYHTGVFLVPVKEGILCLPYDEIDAEEYELLVLKDAKLLGEEDIQYFIDDWVLFSDDLLAAMRDMQKILKECD